MLRSNEARRDAGTVRGIRNPSWRLLRMWRKARQASLLMEGPAEGLMRFHAERMSVSGTSRDSYRSSREETEAIAH